MSAFIFHRGDQVVWLIEPFGHSAVHIYRADRQTFCSREVPDDDRLIPSHNRYRTCGVCNRMYNRAEKERERETEARLQEAS